MGRFTITGWPAARMMPSQAWPCACHQGGAWTGDPAATSSSSAAWIATGKSLATASHRLGPRAGPKVSAVGWRLKRLAPCAWGDSRYEACASLRA